MSRATIDTRSLSDTALLRAAREVYGPDDLNSYWHPEDQMAALDAVRRAVIGYVNATAKRPRPS